jgi:hypothetical protein
MRYIIVDFCASTEKTHHLQYVDAYYKFLKSENQNVSVILPKYSSHRIKDTFKSDGKYILNSHLFGADLESNKTKFFSNKLIELFINILPKQMNVKLLFINLFKDLYSRSLINYISKEANDESQEITIIFPSSEPLAIHSSQIILDKRIRIRKIILRLITIEDRGILGGSEIIKNIINLSYNHHVAFGFETENYMQHYKKLGLSLENSSIIPLPSLKKCNENLSNLKMDSNDICFGFLGTAKKRKGFEEIPNLIAFFQEIYGSCSFIIQGTDTPWQEYNVIKKSIMGLKAEIKFIENVISLSELTRIVSDCDFICLPYSSNEYKNSGSAIAYLAADNFVPILMYGQLGFTRELEKYSVGLVLTNKLKKTDLENFKANHKYNTNFEKYNDYRNAQNRSFM